MAAGKRHAPAGRAEDSPGQCPRAYVHALLPAWHLEPLADDAELVVSELVTNAGAERDVPLSTARDDSCRGGLQPSGIVGVMALGPGGTM